MRPGNVIYELLFVGFIFFFCYFYTAVTFNPVDVADNISYISTGGGAFLEFLEGKKLPAVQILEESARAWALMERAREY